MNITPISRHTSLHPKKVTLKHIYNFKSIQNETNANAMDKIIRGQQFIIDEIPTRLTYVHNKYYSMDTIKNISHYSIERLFGRYHLICSKFQTLNEDKLIPIDNLIELNELRGI